jgi:uncharacterized membrane protein
VSGITTTTHHRRERTPVTAAPKPPAPPSRPGVMSTNRVEAFSDGVLAIAITLLVLDLVVPPKTSVPEGALGSRLAHQWPAYLAYLVSFMVIGIIWVNHHTVFAKVRLVDRRVLFANLALLLVVSAIPFPTRLIAEYLTTGANSHLAAAVYSGTMVLMSLAYSALWMAVTRDVELLHEHVDRAAGRAAIRRFGLGIIIYLATVGLAFVNAIATLAVHGVLAVYYCFDQLAGADRNA